MNDTFNDTFQNDINKHKAILTQKRTLKKIFFLCFVFV